MNPEKEFNEELKTTFRIYKIAGVIIVLLLLIGVLYAIVKSMTEKPTEAKPPAPSIVPTLAPVPEQNITRNVTQNITANKSISNVTAAQNITVNATPKENKTNVTAAQLLNLTVPTPAPVNYSWNAVKIAFPDTLKKIPSGKNSNQYIEVTEADGTPVANDEQFDISVALDDHHGKSTEIISTYENSKWLVTLLIANDGNYTLSLTVTCAPKKGHCKRFYGDGNAAKSTDFEVV